MRLVLLIAAVFSMNIYADVIRPLPRADALHGIAKRVGTVLNDGNISTGSTKLSAGLLNIKSIPNTSDEVKAIAEKGFFDALKKADEEMGKTRVVPQVEAGLFVDGEDNKSTVGRMTFAIMESNAYDMTNEDILKKSSRQVWAVLRKLPLNAETRVAMTSVKLQDNATQELVYVRYFLVFNKDGRAVQLFTIQGSM